METFRYSWKKTTIINTTLLSVAMFTGAALWAFYENEISGGLFLLALGYLVLLPLYLNARLMNSPIQISKNDISLNYFGMQMRKIKWSDVKRIRVVVSRSVVEKREMILYCIDWSSVNRPPFLPGGPITFDDTIQGYEHLVGLVQDRAREYQIPIVDNRRNGEGTG